MSSPQDYFNMLDKEIKELEDVCKLPLPDVALNYSHVYWGQMASLKKAKILFAKYLDGMRRRFEYD